MPQRQSIPHRSESDRSDAFRDLKVRIAARYNKLPKRLKQISEFVLEHPNYVALDTVVENARRAGVPPSALVRFAQVLGYSGFREMQRVFQSPLLLRAPSYAERARDLRHAHPRGRNELHGLLAGFCTGSIVALEHLPELISSRDLNRAVNIMVKARQLHIVAHRRSFAAAGYLAYALALAGKPTHLLHGLGGLLAEQCRLIEPADALIAISFMPYAPETLAVVENLAGRSVPVVALSDGKLSPLARHSKVLFEIKEAEIKGFRSLTSTMVVAQALAVGLAMRLAQNN
jgi:DNA-binding MurR/RpiR family transcriptional regulator